MFSHLRVAERLVFEQIDRPAEEVREAKLQIEIIVGILQRRFVGDVHDQIHIAFIVEAIGEDRAEGKQPLDAVSAAEVSYLCVVLAEEVHAGGASDFARFDVQLDLLHRPIVVTCRH